MDSVGEGFVCPTERGKTYKTATLEKWMRFVNAGGGQMGHSGAKETKFKASQNKDKLMSFGLQRIDVTKPLVAVWRIAEKGNIVQFGQGETFPSSM